jgi:hypothetical protein
MIGGNPNLYFARAGTPLTAVEITPEGLCLHYHDQTRQTRPWREIVGAEAAADGLRVVFADGSDLHLAIFEARQTVLTEIITRTAGNSREALTPAIVEGWLGLPPGGSKRWGGPRWSSVFSALGLVLFMCPVFLVYAMMQSDPSLRGGRHPRSGVPVLLVPIVLAALMLVMGLVTLWQWWRDDRIVADGQGLTAARGRRRRSCAWSEITGLTSGASGWHIETAAGPLLLPDDQQSAILVDVIRRILALRQAGRGLPCEEPVSDTSISRAGGEAESDERGISLAEGGHE